MKSKENRPIPHRLTYFASLTLVLFLSGTLLAKQSPTAKSALRAASTPANDELRISAHAYHEDLILKVSDLKAMPRTTVAVHNEHSKADETYSGVRLADVLTKIGAPLGKDLRGPALSAYLIASGTDGYDA